MTVELLDRVRMKGRGYFGDDADGNEVNLSELEFVLTGFSDDGVFAHIAPITGYPGYGWDVPITSLEKIE